MRIMGPSMQVLFSSPIKLYQALRKKGGKTPSLYRIRNWMEKNDNYNLQKLIMRSFRTAKVVVSGKNEQYDVDLADLSTWMNENDGNRYLLIVIDVFSRYLWVEPLKSKTGSEVKKALQKIDPKYQKKLDRMEVLNFQIEKLVDSLNKMGFIIILQEIVQRPVMRKGLF